MGHMMPQSNAISNNNQRGYCSFICISSSIIHYKDQYNVNDIFKVINNKVQYNTDNIFKVTL